MRDKILLRLKELRGTANKDVSDRTLETFATQLEATITEDGQLEAGVLPYKGIIESIQGNFNAFAAANAKPVEPIVKPVEPVVKPVEPVEPVKKEGLTLEDLTAAITAAQAPLLQEINAIKDGNVKAKMIEDAKLAISEKFQLEESEMAGSNYILEQISDRDFENVEAFVTSYESEYNKLRAATGMGTVMPKDNKVLNPDEPVKDSWAEKKKAEIKAAEDRKQEAHDRIHGDKTI